MQLKEKGKPTNTFWCMNCNKDITFFDDGWVAEDLHLKAEKEKLKKRRKSI